MFLFLIPYLDVQTRRIQVERKLLSSMNILIRMQYLFGFTEHPCLTVFAPRLAKSHELYVITTTCQRVERGRYTLITISAMSEDLRTPSAAVSLP